MPDTLMTEEQMRTTTLVVMFLTLLGTFLAAFLYQVFRDIRNRRQDKAEREALAKKVEEDTTSLVVEVKREADKVSSTVEAQTTAVVHVVEKEVAKLETAIKEVTSEIKEKDHES